MTVLLNDTVNDTVYDTMTPLMALFMTRVETSVSHGSRVVTKKKPGEPVTTAKQGG